MTTPAHPQRCEHYPVCYYVRDRKENKISECFLCIADDPYLKMVCGMDTRCASHSSQQSERDTVLDEFYSKLHKRSFKGNRGVVIIELKDINEIFEELRSNGEP